MHAQTSHTLSNVTSLGFAYNVNHVIMTSSAFMFYPCHIGMWWHDVTGVHVA